MVESAESKLAASNADRRVQQETIHDVEDNLKALQAQVADLTAAAQLANQVTLLCTCTYYALSILCI